VCFQHLFSTLFVSDDVVPCHVLIAFEFPELQSDEDIWCIDVYQSVIVIVSNVFTVCCRLVIFKILLRIAVTADVGQLLYL